MFTGIIEGLAEVEHLSISGGAGRLRLAMGGLAPEVRLGDSVAVNGACLTAAMIAGSDIEFDVSAETLRVTTLGDLQPGNRVNIERALKAGDRLGGHFVMGHVDAVGSISRLSRDAGQVTLRVEAGREFAAQCIPKGSVAVDGISLTIAELDETGFSVAVIPHTIAKTTLQLKREGARVNLESDVIGKYVARLLHFRTGGSITEKFLAEHGFM